MKKKSPIEEAALTYLKRGWSVVPIRPREKYPLVPWRELQDRPPTESELRSWFRRWPDANIGIVTGAVSRLVVLDVDPRHGGDVSLAQLIREHGALPATVEAVTGSGGRHLYLLHPGYELHNRVGLLPGIDLRGDGGLIVAPPSIHPSGRRYEWAGGRSPVDAPIAALPVWLATLAQGGASRPGHTAAYWRALLREGVTEGERNNAIASLTGRLLWHGLEPRMITELLLCWNAVRCRPPLAENEVVRTVENIVRTHQSGAPAANPPPPADPD